MAFFVTARRAVFHSSPRMPPYLRPAHSRPPCLFYATPPRTPHSCILSVPRRAMYSPAAPHSRSNNHPTEPRRHAPPTTTAACLIPNTARCAASHIRSSSPPTAPRQRPAALPHRLAAPAPLYHTTSHPKQPPDTACPIPPAHTSPPCTQKNRRGRHPFASASAVIVLRNDGKNSPPIPLVMRSCS